jgi:hypothetical protein
LDTCDCYKYQGSTRGDFNNIGSKFNENLREAWTGWDCSLRTCPVAYSWSGATPNGLSSSLGAVTVAAVAAGDFSVEVGSADLSTGGAYKHSIGTVGSKIRYVITATGATGLLTVRSVAAAVITTYEALPAMAIGAATFYGAPAEEDGAATTAASALDSNGAHGMLECAGQGLCDRATGQCQCFPGYEGEACTRTVCPNSCSGHGICLAATRLASDASETYTQAWDQNKHFGCKCDIGYRGPDCSLQECPSSYDPLNGCGGGQCNIGTTDNAAQACPNAGTSDCNTILGGEQRDCSGRGICDYESGVCKCFTGFYGEACSSQTILI